MVPVAGRWLYLLSILCILVVHIPSAHADCYSPLDVWKHFSMSGYMGQTDSLDVYEAWTEGAHSEPHCVKIDFQPGDRKSWAGVYWMNEPDNWCQEPGANLSLCDYTRITFWARGGHGGETVEFKAGGIKNCEDGGDHKDSFKVSMGKVNLGAEWRQYSIPLKGKDLSSVIGAFCWVASASANPKGLVFYIDGIQFERDEPDDPSVETDKR